MTRLVISLFLMSAACGVNSHGSKNTIPTSNDLHVSTFNKPSAHSSNIPHKDHLKNSMIIGGTPTTIEKYPYQVSILSNGYPTSGGTIISEKYVLTAAHCVDGRGNYSVRAGSSYANSGGVVYAVSSLKLHHLYKNTESYYNDIALLKISSNFDFNKTMKPVKLMTQNEVLAPNTMTTVIGWGKTSYPGPPSNVLLETDVPIVSHERCSAQTLIFHPKYADKELCAGYDEGGHGPCNGDSGGPLLLNNTQVGIVSHGKACAQQSLPDHYINVAFFRDWIANNSGV